MALANINVPSVNKAAHVIFMGATSISGGKAGLVPAPAAGEEDYFLRGDGTWANGSVDLPTVPVYTAGYGLSLADNEFSVTLQGGSNTTFDDGVVDNINKFFKPRVELQDRYARAPFDEANICNLDLSHLIDGVNFELDTENLTDGAVTRIRSGLASYNGANGISRGYVEVKTICKCTVTVTYSISSQSSYDYGGCIVTEGAPNTTFTLANLKAANFFYKAGSYANQTKTYTLDANKTYYLNFGYAKNASTNSNDDRFYIHSITVTPELYADSEADFFFHITSDVADTIKSGIGGKLLPTVSSPSELLTFSSTIPYLENKVQKVLAGNNYQCEAKAAIAISPESVNGYPRKVSLASGTSTPYTHSLVTYLNTATPRTLDSVTLASDTSTYTYNYGLVKLTESGGFITRRQKYATGYNGTFYVQPFVVTADGKPSLGTNTSIMSAQSSSYPTSYVSMTRSIFTPTNIMFYVIQQTANGYDHKYTTIEFQGIGTGLTRVKTLTTLGTDYTNYAGKKDLRIRVFETQNQPVVFNKELETFSPGFRSYVFSSEYFSYPYYPFINYHMRTYDSSGALTASTGYSVVNHGLYRSAPTVFTYETSNSSFALDSDFFTGIWRSKSCPGVCYAVTARSSAKCTTGLWLNSCFFVHKIDFLAGVCDFEYSNHQLTSFINDFVFED